MVTGSLNALMADDIFLSGEHAPGGLYREIHTGRELALTQDAILPCGLDGCISAYTCLNYAWSNNSFADQTPNSKSAAAFVPATHSSIRENRNMYSLLLADAHEQWSDNICDMVKGTEFTIVGKALSGEQAVSMARTVRPDIVMLDVLLAGGVDGDTLKALTHDLPKTSVVLTSDSSSLYDAMHGLTVGAVGYMVQNVDRESFLSLLRVAAAGQWMIRL